VTGNKCRLIDISKLAVDSTPTYCDALIGHHAFTRCDTASAFKGIGKIKPIQLLQKTPRYQELFQDLGKSWNVSEDLCLGLEKFVCQMYKQKATKTTELDTLRHTMLMEKCESADGKLDPKKTINLSSLPPPRVCLIGHIKRTNYQVGIWKRSLEQNPSIPAAVDDNGWVMVGESIEPKWCEGEILPASLADILETVGEKSDYDDDDYQDEEESGNDETDTESDSD